ncbi:MAG: esterase-like activity of phytase family protein [Actinomycetota bacterium]|nr:esterase-like activity of phytase family protein [Actinomycetota bacterium]
MLGPGRSRTAWAALALTALLATAALAPAATGKKGPKRGPSLEFRGQVIIPTGTTFQGTQVGGLSGIAHAGGGTFYTLSDDQANARFYKLHAAIADGQLSAGDITFQSVTTLKQPDGTPYPTASLDPEGFALTKHNRQAVVTSEGFATRLINPWIRVYKLDGSYVRDLPVPDDFNPNAAGTRGVRQNLGFESAATRGKNLFTGTEAALVQDGPPATLTNGSPARLLRYDLKRNTLQRQWTYMVDPIAEPFSGFGVSGLVEVLPLGKERLLTMERSFSVGAPGTGNKIKLYVTDLRKDGSTSKSLLLNLDALGLPLDNVEGMAFGPRLRGGKRTLLLVSDNNFAASQFTQFLLFTISNKKK